MVSVVYVGTTFWLFNDRLHLLKTMDLNESGDFLAGVFGPLALLWLILGFFQQGLELRQNTQALELQAEELRNSVEQQRAIVVATREQIEHEHNRANKASRPIFIGRIVDNHIPPTGGPYASEIAIKNSGATVDNVIMIVGKELKIGNNPFQAPNSTSWESGDERIIKVQDLTAERNEIKFRYWDRAGNSGNVVFELERDPAKRRVLSEIILQSQEFTTK